MIFILIFLLFPHSLQENPQSQGITSHGSRSFPPQILTWLLSDPSHYCRLCFCITVKIIYATGEIWLKIWEKIIFSCFHPLFLEAQVSRQCNLFWLHLETKSWSIYTSSSGNGDLLSHKAIHVQCVHSRGPVWGVREGSAGADILLVCRPMGGRAVNQRGW